MRYIPTEYELFHIHTRRCKHAEDIADEEYIKKALEHGAKRIVFTDHAPFPGNFFTGRMDIEELPEYVESIHELKEKYRDQIEVLCGLEVEYLPYFDHYIKGLKDSGNFDILLLGQHMCEMEDDPMSWSFSMEDKSREHILLADAMVKGIDTGYFDVVAHPDRIFRHVKNWSDEEDELAREIIVHAAERSLPLERNYSSMKRKNQFRPEFWDKIEVPMVFVEGIDAHSLAEIDDWVNWIE